MARASRNLFTTIKTEGGLLPPDFLQRLVEGSKGVDGLTPESYHLIGGEKPNEAASRSWNRLQTAWSAFQTAGSGLKPEDAGTGLTREKWLLPLFSELGYGRLQPAKTFEIDGKPYPISHLWQLTPIHLVGRNVQLDRRSPGVIGAAKTTPHGLMQEFLNRHEGHLWGFVSNGLKLRILRDNKSLTRQAYVEFDLAGMMDGQVYSDFAVLFLLCHQSRVEAERAEQCYLEKWADAARAQGTRALDQLREGVEGAIKALGRGFLAQPANKELVERLRSGALDKQDYYRQLLRTVYRLIFLFVAEDRDLLLTAPHGSKERKRYLDHYSAERLRRLAEHRRGTPHPDLWQALRLVFAKLSSDTGCKELGLPALGSFLWSDKATTDLNRCELSNADLLETVRSLAFTLEGKLRRAIDYRNLGAEELGSVYESLLELHPDLNADAPTFDLKVAAGHERKTTGSYYTPTSLIECLLDSALDPVLQEAAQQSDPEKAILDLKVCDPACGSGHFLIAAAHRMANRLAAVRTGDEEPSPEAVRKSLRDIVGRCLFGVDINPMAVELCKVNLWLEALEPGKPLSFLEHHIQCGNSLLGATPALLRRGIPDDAFEPLEGDDKKVCRILAKQNKSEREGQQGSLLDALHELPQRELADLSAAVTALDAIPDETIEGQKQKQRQWSDVVGSSAFDHARITAHAWCASFVWRKADNPVLLYGITERSFRRIEQEPASVPSWMSSEVARLGREYQLFHWHLSFPGVFRPPSAHAEVETEGPGWQGGFDVVIGNPPWDRIKLQEKEFFAERHPNIASAPNAAARAKLVKALETEDPALFMAFRAAVRRADGESVLVRSTARYPLCGRGDVNTYAVFAELNRSLLAPRGRAGFIVPSGIATDDTTKFFFQDVVERRHLVSLYDFENRRKLFPAVDSRMKFCLLTLAGPHRVAGPSQFVFFALDTNSLADRERRFTLGPEDLRLLNPDTRTCPVFRTRRDAEMTKSIYRRASILGAQVEQGGWGIDYLLKLVDPTIHRALLAAPTADGQYRRIGSGEVLADEPCPVYEGKLMHQFDHRYASFPRTVAAGGPQPAEDPETALLTDKEKADPSRQVSPRFWLGSQDFAARLEGRAVTYAGFLCLRDITNVTNERTMIATMRPFVPAANSLGNVFCRTASDALFLCGCLNSFAADYIARQKIGGTHLSPFYLLQLAVVPPALADGPCPWDPSQTSRAWVESRVLELVYTSWDLQPFARDVGYDGSPFVWDAPRRLELRCELDGAFFHLYDIARDDVDYILGTFPIVQKSDETRYGDYRTKLMILDAYDRMTRAADSRA